MIIVFDAAGNGFRFTAHTATRLPDGGLEVHDADGDMVAFWSATGWVGVVEDGSFEVD